MKKVINFMKEKATQVKKAATFMVAAAAVVVMGTVNSSAAYVPSSLIPTETETVLNNFAADIGVTITALVALTVPVLITVFGAKFSIKKGLNILFKALNRFSI